MVMEQMMARFHYTVTYLAYKKVKIKFKTAAKWVLNRCNDLINFKQKKSFGFWCTLRAFIKQNKHKKSKIFLQLGQI